MVSRGAPARLLFKSGSFRAKRVVVDDLFDVKRQRLVKGDAAIVHLRQHSCGEHPT